MTTVSPEVIEKWRQECASLMLDSRWLTCADVEQNESGEFVGYMAEGIFTNFVLPMLIANFNQPTQGE